MYGKCMCDNYKKGKIFPADMYNINVVLYPHISLSFDNILVCYVVYLWEFELQLVQSRFHLL